MQPVCKNVFYCCFYFIALTYFLMSKVKASVLTSFLASRSSSTSKKSSSNILSPFFAAASGGLGFILFVFTVHALYSKSIFIVWIYVTSSMSYFLYKISCDTVFSNFIRRAPQFSKSAELIITKRKKSYKNQRLQKITKYF